MNLTLSVDHNGQTTSATGTLEHGMAALESLLTGENLLFAAPAAPVQVEDDAPDPEAAQAAFLALFDQLS